MTLLLRRSEISNLLDLRQAMVVLESTFREQAEGKVKQVAPLRFMDRGMRMVVGGLLGQNINGLRVSVTGGESAALLFEISSGDLISIMGYPFSELRISATVALAIERLASPNARKLALIGSGRLALPILAPAIAVRPIEEVFVYSPTARNRERFAEDAAGKLKVPVGAVSSPEAALAEADIVLVSTNSPRPALRGEFLRPGVSVFGVGRPNEFDDEVYLRANLISITSRTHELGYYDTRLDQPLIRLSGQAKQIRWEEVAEFCDIVSGKVSIPNPAKNLLVFRDSQGGYGDLALAAWVYERARQIGLGQEITIE